MRTMQQSMLVTQIPNHNFDRSREESSKNFRYEYVVINLRNITEPPIRSRVSKVELETLVRKGIDVKITDKDL